ncbi:MAG: 50S ribosomal protein L9 [bacterium]
MKVILLEDVKSLGHKGDVVEVSEGYARNFLFPQHVALEASETALKEKDQKEKAATAKARKEEKEERKLAAKLDGFELIMTVKTDEGKLYAAVTSKDIAKGLKDAGYKVDPEWINFASTKETGTSEAVVNFPGGFEATVNIVIESK